eukprot:COSAG01_NODE_19952_length_980_cov_1.127128_1_plen_273_part_00
MDNNGAGTFRKQAKLRHELQVEAAVLAIAARAADGDTQAAQHALAQPWAGAGARSAKAWRLRAFELAFAINKSLGGCGHWGGMSVLQSQDPTLGLVTIDTPLSDSAYLKAQLRVIASLPTEEAKHIALQGIGRWTDPGPGGYYDQLGAIPRSPRLSSGFGERADPQFLYAPLVSYDEGGAEEAPLTGSSQRISWYSYAQAYWNASVSLRQRRVSVVERIIVDLETRPGFINITRQDLGIVAIVGGSAVAMGGVVSDLLLRDPCTERQERALA